MNSDQLKAAQVLIDCLADKVAERNATTIRQVLEGFGQSNSFYSLSEWCELTGDTEQTTRVKCREGLIEHEFFGTKLLIYKDQMRARITRIEYEKLMKRA